MTKKKIKAFFFSLLFIAAAAALIFLMMVSHTLPKNFDFYDHRADAIEKEHHSYVKKIIDTPKVEDKKKIIEDYLYKVEPWVNKLNDCIAFFQKNREGYSTSVKSKIAARSYNAKQTKELILHTQRMFENALEGRAEEEDLRLLKFKSNRTYYKRWFGQPSTSSDQNK